MYLCVLRILVHSNNERYVKADINRISKHAFVSMAKFEENKRVKWKQQEAQRATYSAPEYNVPPF